MLKLIFVNRFFYPDHSATSQILTDLAKHLAHRGYKVQVITSRLSYEDPGARLMPREQCFGVDVVRVATTRFGRGNLIGRSFDYLSFYFSAFVQLLASVRKGDVVVAKTDPPLIGVVCAVAARIKGARLINWLQDVFPEVGTALGMRVLQGVSGTMLKEARDWGLRVAVANVVLGRRMRCYLADRTASEKIVVIHNWTDDANITPCAHENNHLRGDWALQSYFVVGYSGNLGRAHEVETILRAATLLRRERHVRFLMIGGGAQMRHVREYVAAQGLNNVIFQPYQARDQLPWSLAAADLHLVSLDPSLESYIVPSKIYGIAAAARPMAFIGAANGEVATLLRESGCGAAFVPGDAEGLVEFICRLAGEQNMATVMGEYARRTLDAHFTQKRAFELWRELLDEVMFSKGRI